jgi:uncharacterized membrane protein YfhO
MGLRKIRDVSIQRVIETAAAFLLPLLLMGSVLAAMGVFPFGDKTLLVGDMHSEYVHYFTYLHRAVRGGGSLLRSWSMGMGLNMMGLLAFYTASPFNLLILLVPETWLTEAIFAVTLLKMGTCGLTFQLFLRGRTGRAGSGRLLFSTAYALMGYSVYYASNIMWLDGVAVLPLVIWGAERLYRERKGGLLLGALIYAFFTSYYIGYMIGIFTFLYYTACHILDKVSFKAYVRGCCRLGGVALLAAGCCAVLLLPAFLNLWQGQSEMWAAPTSSFSGYVPAQLGYKLIPGRYDSLTDTGLPNLYFSLWGLWAAVLYFLNRRIPTREKWCFGGLLAVLVISLCSGLLDLAWHAFENPTWFPARYAFVFPFLCLYLGARGLSRREGLSPRQYTLAAALMLGFLLQALFLKEKAYEAEILCLLVFLPVAYAILHIRFPARKSAALLLLVLLAGELWYNAYAICRGIDEQLGYKNRADYLADQSRTAAALALLPAAGVYRTERAAMPTANSALSLGYRSISHYSTTTDQALNELLHGLGYNTGTINELRFAPGSPAISGLLGVRYLLSEQSPGECYKFVGEAQGIGVYENPYAYPLAFFAESVPLELDGADPFAKTNQWASALGGEEDVFLPLQATEGGKNASYILQENGIHAYTRLDARADATLSFAIPNPHGREAYLWFDCSDCRFSRATAYVNGREAGRVLAYRSNPVIALGSGGLIDFTALFDGGNLLFRDVHVRALNENAALSGAAKAKEQAMAITTFTDTAVDGHLTAPTAGVLATTFPYDTGWLVRVNGKKVEGFAYAGAFLAIPLEAGEQTIIMRYRPPGFLPGAIISLVSILAAVVLSWTSRRGSRE